MYILDFQQNLLILQAYWLSGNIKGQHSKPELNFILTSE